MRQVTNASLCIFAASFLAASFLPAKLAGPGFEFGIRDIPQNLRTDLKGVSIRFAVAENAPDRAWDDLLMSKFHELTGIEVQIIRLGNDTTTVLSSYLRHFRDGSPQADVYDIDIVWPGILSQYAQDLRLDFGNLRDMAPVLVENDTANGKLVAVPYFTEISLLYYRRDLLEKYHFPHPPSTWRELEQQARTIMRGERAEGKKQFWGFLWQGAASEALTCNALEWQISQGGGSLLSVDGTLSIERERTAEGWQRARQWIGTLSPPDVTRHLEDDSLRLWKNGDAAFMRNWPYAYVESMRAGSGVKDRIGVTLVPKGDGLNARHADTLGGFQLMVSKTTKYRDAAVELVKFLTSPEIQRVNAITRGYAPTRPAIYDDPAVLQSNALFGTLRHVLLEGANTPIHRRGRAVRCGVRSLFHGSSACADWSRERSERRCRTGQESAEHAIGEFLQSCCPEPRLSLNKTVVTRAITA